MKNLFSRIFLFELVNMKSQLVVEVNVQTKPNNDLINTAILGVMSSSIGRVSGLISAGGLKQRVLLNFKNFTKLYSKIITPSISDDGNIRFVIRENSFEVVYGSCNNIIQIIPALAEIAGVNDTNVEVVVTVKQIRGKSGLEKVAGIVRGLLGEDAE